MGPAQATYLVREALRALPGIAVAQGDRYGRAIAQINKDSAAESKRRGARARTAGRRPATVYPDALLTVRSHKLADGSGGTMTLVRQPDAPRGIVHPRVRSEVARIAAEHGATYREPDGVSFILYSSVEIEWPPG